MKKRDSRLIAVPLRLIPLLGELRLLDEEGIEEVQNQLAWIKSEVSLRNRKILDQRKGGENN